MCSWQETLPTPGTQCHDWEEFSLFTFLGDGFLFIYPYPEGGVPDLYQGFLSYDFTTEDILDVTNYLWEQVEDDDGKSLEHIIAPREHSTTAIISINT